MDIVIYRGAQSWAAPLLEAFAEGLIAHGIEPEIRTVGDWRVCDLAVIWAHRADVMFKAQRDAGRHYLVMERGYIGDIEARRAWTSLGLDGLNGRAVFPKPDDGHRWEKNFVGAMKPWRDDGDYALLMGQVPGDASIAHVDINKWYAEAAASLAADWHRPVMFRPHPVAVQRNQVDDVYGTIRLTTSLESALEGAAVVATFNSNSGVDAVLAGVPTIAMDRGSMAWDVAAHDWDHCAKPDRTKWAAQLAFSQWTRDEIASGVAWQHLTGVVNGS